MYAAISWGAHCSLIVGGECVQGGENEGCESLGGGQCMNHARG